MFGHDKRVCNNGSLNDTIKATRQTEALNQQTTQIQTAQTQQMLQNAQSSHEEGGGVGGGGGGGGGVDAGAGAGAGVGDGAAGGASGAEGSADPHSFHALNPASATAVGAGGTGSGIGAGEFENCGFCINCLDMKRVGTI